MSITAVPAILKDTKGRELIVGAWYGLKVDPEACGFTREEVTESMLIGPIAEYTGEGCFIDENDSEFHAVYYDGFVLQHCNAARDAGVIP